ncbi:TspO/MBR family protein [Phormidium sp. CLA17]|uniref:TspO/MBR family protein n=1 Tax=Leptolyngbya sp. Cla-17 TaxID=2803751 RepID=UPI001491B3F3|nr:TspO/MBR family protein [Leptolyngbya sp. Cla-17]MBM0741559.1 TspO/MBR family protein [Leptolyngbya sp. Cla-17]
MIRSWMVIGAVAIAVAFSGNILGRNNMRWFRQLRRPKWLTFEPLIPVIWTVILICGAWSAYLVWESNPGTEQTWWLMAFYLLLEIVIIAYSPVTIRLRNLKAGTIVGGIGFIIGLILAFLVQPISNTAFWLLVPYLLWSPIGTYTTWAMHQLNGD